MKLASVPGGATAFLLLVGLLVLGALPAGAFLPVSQNDTYEIRLPEFGPAGSSPVDRAAGLQQAEAAMAARYGGVWRVHSWNPQAAAPRWLYGSSIKMADGIGGPADVERLARQAIAQNADILRADPTELRFTAAPHGMGKWAAHFQQTWNGIDVNGATVRLVFTDDGRLMLLGSDFQPEIELSPFPTVTEAQAVEIARSGVPFNASTDRVEPGTALLVLPYPLSASEVEHHLVWRVRVRTEEPLGAWVTHVDAHDGRILWRYNDIHFAYLGTTDTEVQHFGYCDGIVPMSIPYLRINVNGVGTVNTDAQGSWSIEGTGGPRTVTADLYGPYVDVNNMASGMPQASFTGTAQENVPLEVTFYDVNAQKDERDVFDAVNDVHDFIEAIDPGFGYSNTRITANVSRNSTCNAYWDGTINFYREGGGCANTGEMQQVVHHEFTHGIQNFILGGQGGQGLGEGNADICGNLITQDPIIGRGFYLDNCTSGIRNSLNTLVYPDDVVGEEIHFAGQVIAGFNWDAMVLLQAQYGTELGTRMSAERWHFGRVLLHPQTQPDQVFATFVADDDNGELIDGTPHYDIFCEAAQNHSAPVGGFTCPERVVGPYLPHVPYPYTVDNVGAGYEVRSTVISYPIGQGAIVPESVQIHYRVNGGGFVDVAMAPTGNPDEYAGTIPAQPWGTVLEYYLSAENDLDQMGTSPIGAPDLLHYFQVDDEFPDDMELPTAWAVGGPGDNTAASGSWERADPQGTTYNGQPIQPEDDHTPAPGTMCWITGAAAGSQAGSFDVDGGQTVLYSPRFDLRHMEDITVRYWKYYTNDRGNNPGDDYWDVDVTNDGGETWTDVEHTTTSTNAWVEHEIALADYVPDPEIVQFRFIASDVAPGSLIEAGLDDFLLTGTVIVTGADEGFQVRFVTGLDQNRPNPFHPATDIRFALAQAGDVDLAIFDLAGRRIATLADSRMDAGEHHVRWDGTDGDGHAVPAGTYFCRLDAAGKTFSARMVLLK